MSTFSITTKLSFVTTQMNELDGINKIGARILNLASIITSPIDAITHFSLAVFKILNATYSVMIGKKVEAKLLLSEALRHLTLSITYIALTVFAPIVGFFTPQGMNHLLFAKDKTIFSGKDKTANAAEVSLRKTPSEIAAAKAELKNIYLNEIKYLPGPMNTYNSLQQLNQESSGFLGIASSIEPQSRLAFLNTFDENSKSFTLPVKGLNPKIKEDLNFLKDLLTHSFASGKEFIVVELGSNTHANIAAFRSDGSFQIIDSMLSQTVDLNHLTTELNGSKIKDINGNEIVFKGKYINTHLQKGGNECRRFACLYGYQMAKKQDFEAYKEVNGAFAEGKLKTFEDLHKIDGSPLLSDASSIPKKNYDSFMRSWGHRAFGLKCDSWKEIPLSDLTTMDDCERRRTFYELTSNAPVSCRFNNSEHDLTLQDGSAPLLLDIKDLQKTTLGDLIPKDGGKVVINMEVGKAPVIFHLLPGQEIPGLYKKVF